MFLVACALIFYYRALILETPSPSLLAKYILNSFYKDFAITQNFGSF